MKFGMLHLFESPMGRTEYQVMKEQLDLMRSAEDLGFDSVWPAEHHFSDYGYCASPAVSLAAIASVTKRIRLGTGIVVLPFHNPIRVAEEYAMLDLMSDGRVDFGVGRGYQPIEFKGFQLDQAKSRGIFNESLEIIMQAWTQERVNFKGVHFNIQDLAIRPKPLQKPHPPVWVAGLSEATFPMVGKWGCNLLCAPVFGFQGNSAADLLNSYRQALRASGHDPATKEIAALCMVYCAETTAQARREFSESVMWYYRTIAKYIAPPAGQGPVKTYELYTKTRDLAAKVSFEELLEAGALICGDRDHCIEQITSMKEKLGFTQLLCWTRLGGLDTQKVLKSMELMQKHVIPYFKKEELAAA
ncbi:MAG TPA: LLM class flavin-dependent oxidoreductase [Candidatus Binataceae bacterium]|nr:LLM class flavin-dependent oxidoreductase [Candidatus Binataceae bacterium]